jgi:hypothetical protein
MRPMKPFDPNDGFVLLGKEKNFAIEHFLPAPLTCQRRAVCGARPEPDLNRGGY